MGAGAQTTHPARETAPQPAAGRFRRAAARAGCTLAILAVAAVVVFLAYVGLHAGGGG